MVGHQNTKRRTDSSCTFKITWTQNNYTDQMHNLSILNSVTSIIEEYLELGLSLSVSLSSLSVLSDTGFASGNKNYKLKQNKCWLCTANSYKSLYKFL